MHTVEARPETRVPDCLPEKQVLGYETYIYLLNATHIAIKRHAYSLRYWAANQPSACVNRPWIELLLNKEILVLTHLAT